MISDDEYLERIVAGIQAVTSSDAEVRWNERINGRQFDVVVRFRLGTLKYLVLIEVKNRVRPASAADLESFVTKARDNQANKAVFVTAAGFQQGATAVARRHAIDLFTVRFDKDDAQISPRTNFIVRNLPGRKACSRNCPSASRSSWPPSRTPGWYSPTAVVTCFPPRPRR